MNEDSQLRAFLLFVCAFAILALSQAATAGVVVSPSIQGYNRSSGMFKAPSGSFGMTAANDGFIKPTTIPVNGKPVTISPALRMASNAGQFAKSAMRANPWLLAGTAAALWLSDQGITYDDQQGWLKPGTDTPPYETYGDEYPYGVKWFGTGTLYQSTFKCGTANVNQGCSIQDALCSSANVKCGGQCQGVNSYTVTSATNAHGYTTQIHSNGAVTQCLAYAVSNGTPAPSPSSQPMTQQDWDNLEVPPTVVPELPFAPYMPEGVPVDPPSYPTTTVPVGSPYERLDGSTAQPMAKIQDAGQGDVRVDTYDQPLTDSVGNPVPPETPPEPVPETPPPPPDLCETNPDILACAKHGEVPEPDLIPTHEVSFSTFFTPLGSAGQCPSDATLSFLGQPLSWSYSPLCTMAHSIRPLVVGFAWLGFGFIIVAGLRK